MGVEETTEKVKGLTKEVAGKATGSDELAQEGQAQQKKAHEREEAERLEDDARAKRAEAASHAADPSRRQGT